MLIAGTSSNLPRHKPPVILMDIFGWLLQPTTAIFRQKGLKCNFLIEGRIDRL